MNGQHDSSEPGIANVDIKIRPCTDGRKGSTTTGVNGDFIVTKDEGCYYLKLDTSSYQFVYGGGVDTITGRTDSVTVNGGESYFWSMGIVPEETQLTVAPTPSPTTMDPSPQPLPSPFSTMTNPPSPQTEMPTPTMPTPRPTTSSLPVTPPSKSPIVTPIVGPPSAQPSQKPTTNKPTYIVSIFTSHLFVSNDHLLICFDIIYHFSCQEFPHQSQLLGHQVLHNCRVASPQRRCDKISIQY